MDTNEVKPEQSYNNGDLASAEGDSSCDSGRVSSRGKTVKTVIFVIVVALAGTLAAHSMLTASRCGGCGVGGAKMMLPCCPAEAGLQAAACPSEKSCLGAQDTLKAEGCPLAKEAGKGCPNSPGAQAGGCCPGGRHRWGQK